jgi:hypothetical protein
VTDRPPEGFDVPVTRIGGSGRSIRGRLAVVAVVLIAAGWLVVTRSGHGTRDRGTRQPQPRLAAALGASSRPSPSRPPQPNLPDIANTPLAGAPVPVFVVRDGDAAELLGWHAGAASLEPIGRPFPGAFGGGFWDGDSGHFTWLAPDLASLVVVRVASDGSRARTRRGS